MLQATPIVPQPHPFHSLEHRVVAGGYPIVGECGHALGVAFGRVVSSSHMADSPEHNPVRRNAGATGLKRQALILLGRVA